MKQGEIRNLEIDSRWATGNRRGLFKSGVCKIKRGFDGK